MRKSMRKAIHLGIIILKLVLYLNHQKKRLQLKWGNYSHFEMKENVMVTLDSRMINTPPSPMCWRGKNNPICSLANSLTWKQSQMSELLLLFFVPGLIISVCKQTSKFGPQYFLFPVCIRMNLIIYFCTGGQRFIFLCTLLRRIIFRKWFRSPISLTFSKSL